MELLNWFKDNYAELVQILLGVVMVAEMVTRLTPTKKDDGFVERIGHVIKKIADVLKVPNIKKKEK